MTTKQETSQPQLVIRRVFEAPRQLVFNAWTEPERLAKWWGPRGSTIMIKKFELMPGGIFHYGMAMPNGEMWGIFTFREITPPERLLFVSSFSDAEGNIIRGPFFPNWPLEILNTLVLEESNGKTVLTLKGVPINATEQEMKVFATHIQNMQQGFGGTFDQLEEYLKTQF
jgi:uncharacterized protein YndB with AHSA1/START domain